MVWIMDQDTHSNIKLDPDPHTVDKKKKSDPPIVLIHNSGKELQQPLLFIKKILILYRYDIHNILYSIKSLFPGFSC